jgi:hypothetical protein
MSKRKPDIQGVQRFPDPVKLYFKSDKVIDFVSTATKVPVHGLNMYETSVMITFTDGGSLWLFQSFGITINFNMPVRCTAVTPPDNILIPLHILSTIIPCIEGGEELEVVIIGDEIFITVYGGSVDVHGQVGVDDSPYSESAAILREGVSLHNVTSIDIKSLVDASRLLSLVRSNASPQHRLLYLSEHGATVFTTTAAAYIKGEFPSTTFTAKGINVLHSFMSVIENVSLVDTECNIIAYNAGDSLVLCKAADTIPFTISHLFKAETPPPITVNTQRILNILNILHVSAESEGTIVAISFYLNGLILSMPRYQASSPSSFAVGIAEGKTLYEVKIPIDSLVKSIPLLRKDTEIGVSYAGSSVYLLGGKITLVVFGCS